MPLIWTLTDGKAGDDSLAGTIDNARGFELLRDPPVNAHGAYPRNVARPGTKCEAREDMRGLLVARLLAVPGGKRGRH